MQLKRCEIENFGMLSNMSFDFSPGLNQIFLENGGGKSTLAAFIKVMLYGFDDERKRTGERERKRYEPWQGGEYGGKLTFITDKGTFTVCRSFGKNEKSDVFILLDENTGLVSDIYSSDIGMEVLHIDRDTFFNTLFISQVDRTSHVTDNITARMGSRSGIIDDISGYHAAEKCIKDELNHCSPSRKGGILFNEAVEISDIKEKLRKADILEKNLKARSKQIEQAKRKKSDCYREIDEICKEKEKRVSLIGFQEKNKYYKTLLAELDERSKRLEVIRGRLPDIIPDMKEYIEACDKFETYERELHRTEICRLQDDERERLDDVKKKYPNLSVSGYEQSDSFIKEIDSCTENLRNCSRLKDRLHELEMEEIICSSRKKSIPGSDYLLKALAFIGVILSALGTICIFLRRYSGIGLFIAGLFTLCFTFYRKKNSSRSENESEKNLPAEISKEKQEVKKQIQNNEDGLKEFFKCINCACDNHTAEECLRDIREYYFLKKKEIEYYSVTKAVDKAYSILLEKMSGWGIDFDNNPRIQINMLGENLRDYGQCLEECERAKRKLAEFGPLEDTANIDDGLDNEEYDCKDLDEKIIFLQKELEKNDELISEYRIVSAALAEELDSLDLKAKRLSELEEMHNNHVKRYDALKKTQKYLEMAKNNMTNQYTKFISDSLKWYYEIITAEECKLLLDGALNVSVSEGVIPRDVSCMSLGFQDITWLCMRLSFADAMYRDEKPFFIMDDPLINLDEKNTEGAVKVIKNISYDHQVIYFTCHKSRIIGNVEELVNV